MVEIALLCIVFTIPNDGVTRANWDRIRFGMTRPEVYQILGRVSVDESRRPVRLFDFFNPCGNCGELWESGTSSIRVEFDDRGRMVGKRYTGKN